MVINNMFKLIFFTSIPTLVLINYHYNYWTNYIFESLFKDNEASIVYDFIIVGAGSAGSILANRLSKNNHVLLLEAGGDPVYLHSIPALAPDLLHQANIDWGFKTVPQKWSHFGFHENQSKWPRGKMLGGSSNLNWMFYVRGSQHDFNNWANLTNDQAWKWENIKRFYNRAIDYNGRYKSDLDNHPTSGYATLSVEKNEWGPLGEEFTQAAKEMGYKEIDSVGHQRTGISKVEVTQKNGKRHGTFLAFLKDIQHRKNLRISRYSYALKVGHVMSNNVLYRQYYFLLQLKLDKSNRAVGVYYMKNGKKKLALANKEIILSMGTINTPKMLMLSGIGDKKHLNSHKVR